MKACGSFCNLTATTTYVPSENSRPYLTCSKIEAAVTRRLIGRKITSNIKRYTPTLMENRHEVALVNWDLEFICGIKKVIGLGGLLMVIIS